MQMFCDIRAGYRQSRLAAALAVAFLGIAFVILSSAPAHAIPAFARKYGLPCSACHEAWPKLNSFGQNFKDNGYQLNNDRDSPIWLNPSYWPVAMRITPHWHYESASRQSVDSGDGTVEQTIKTSGFDLTGIDILTAGTLAKNVSFLLVPSIDGVAGTVGFESANVRIDNIKGSPWLNFKFGKFELDGPLSEKRMMSFSNTGGAYQLYHYVPAGDINDFTVGENQLGVELMGHSLDDHTRYAASLISSTDGNLGLPGGRSYDGYLHLSQGFMAGKLGLQRVGVFGVTGLRPTYFLTSGGEPVPGTGRGNRSFYRVGAYGSLYVGKFDLTGVFQRASDNVYLGNATPVNGELPEGAQGPAWNTGTFEGHYTLSPKNFILGRYELVRMSRQPLSSLPSDFGNTDVFTAAYRYYPFINSRAGFAWHLEFSTLRQSKTADSGADQRFNSFFTGFDFAF
jgi:hypothetical protein